MTYAIELLEYPADGSLPRWARVPLGPFGAMVKSRADAVSVLVGLVEATIDRLVTGGVPEAVARRLVKGRVVEVGEN